jgi:shikimate 5-dehydrogenase
MVALVVGAGGTALAASYAVQQMLPPMELLVYNRTHSKAEAVAAKFGGRALTMEQLCDPAVLPAVDAVICVIPAKANFELPARLLESRCRIVARFHNILCALTRKLICRPVCIDAAYRPTLTALIKQARAAGCPYILGAQMLAEQGLHQFEHWTKRPAPAVAMRRAILAEVEADLDTNA